MQSKRMSFEEKYVSVNEKLKREIWRAISYTSPRRVLEKTKELSVLTNCQHHGLEPIIVFFIDFFDLLLRCRFVKFGAQEFLAFKNYLIKKGAKNLFEFGEEISGDILRYKQNDVDMFYPVKILERVLFGDEKDFAKLIDFLTSGDYPQDTILHKWLNEYGENRYLLDF